MMPMPIIYLITGIPGSGKTTLAKQLAERHNATVHSYDDMPGANARAGMDGSVKQAWLQVIREMLQSGESVICDSLNLTVAERMELLSTVADIPCEKVLYMKLVPLETCLRRNREREARLPDFVIEQAAQKMEMPGERETWDKIFVSSE